MKKKRAYLPIAIFVLVLQFCVMGTYMGISNKKAREQRVELSENVFVINEVACEKLENDSSYIAKTTLSVSEKYDYYLIDAEFVNLNVSNYIEPRLKARVTDEYTDKYSDGLISVAELEYFGSGYYLSRGSYNDVYPGKIPFHKKYVIKVSKDYTGDEIVVYYSDNAYDRKAETVVKLDKN